MSINWLLIATVVVLLYSICDGYDKGLVRTVVSFVSLVVACIIVALAAEGLRSYADGEVFAALVAILLIAAIGIVKHLMNVVIFPAKVITKLPIISWFDKVLGIVAGAAETILILWTVFIFIMMSNLGMIGQVLVDNIQSSQILTWLYQNNYLLYWLEQLMPKIGL